MEQKGLDPDKTFFWVCDFCITQSGEKKQGDVVRLGEVVRIIGKTVMFLEPWDKMSENCLGRAWCVGGWVVGGVHNRLPICLFLCVQLDNPQVGWEG